MVVIKRELQIFPSPVPLGKLFRRLIALSFQPEFVRFVLLRQVYFSCRKFAFLNRPTATFPHQIQLNQTFNQFFIKIARFVF